MSGKPSASRFTVPARTVVDVGVCLAQAFDGIRLAALAISEGHTDHAVTSLKYIHARLAVIDEVVRAVVAEHGKGEDDGSPRLC